MKSSTYKKNGKGKNDNNTLKGKEIVMKSSTYKRKNGKVVEIVNDINMLQEKTPETVLMACYEDLFNRIDKGSQVVNFVKTTEYKSGLMDSLQNVMAEILTINDYQNKPNIKGYLKKCFFNRVVDTIRYETTYEIFKKDFSEYCQDSTYGITKQYFNEMIFNIKEVLLNSEYEIFKLYHVAGMSSEKISIQLDCCQKTIINRVKTINDKIENLHFKNCFDNRYVSHFSGKKKRQHKRKVMSKKEIIELSGLPYDIAIDDYKESPLLERYDIDLEKLPYSQAHGMKDIMIDKSSYHTIANGNFIYNQVNHVIQNVYSNSCIIPTKEVKEKRHITYRKKRYERKYYRNLKTFAVEQDKKPLHLTLKNGRYLQYLTD